MAAKITVDEALQVLRADYYQGVKSLAKDLIEDAKREGLDREGFLDHLHETVDGHHDVIYTQAAQIVVLCSGHDGRAAEEGMSVADSDGVNWSVLAFFAMEADLLETLDELGFDVNDDDTFAADGDEPTEDVSIEEVQ